MAADKKRVRLPKINVGQRNAAFVECLDGLRGRESRQYPIRTYSLRTAPV